MIKLLALITLLLSCSSYASITERELDGVINKFKENFSSEFLNYTFKDLVFHKDFRKKAARAYIQKRPIFYKITLEKGLITDGGMTSDGVALVICHELGHALGGAPYKKTKTFDKWGDEQLTTSWSIAEGQSDYYATSKCLKKYFEGDFNRVLIKTMNIPASVAKSCDRAFKNDERSAICQRTAMAIHPALESVNSEGTPLSFETPDQAKKEATALGHPSLQCRVDTLLQGALCNIDYNNSPIDGDMESGYCNEDDGFDLGVRPRCWFKPGHRGTPSWVF